MLKMSKYRVVLKVTVSFLLLFGGIGNCHSQSIDDKLSKANSLFFEKDYSNALIVYNQLLPELTDSIDLSYIYSYTAICYENLGDNSTAFLNYKNAVNFKIREYSIYNKLFSLAKKQNDVDCQEYALKQKIKVFPEEENPTLSQLGDLYMRSEQYTKLLDVSEHLIDINAGDYKPYYFQAVAYQKNGDNMKAEENYRKALSLNPEDYASNMGLGFLIFNQASVAFEREQARYAAISNPIWKDYLFYLGNIKKIKGLYTEAKPFLAKACQQKCNSQLEKAMEILKSRTSQIVQNENSPVSKRN